MSCIFEKYAPLYHDEEEKIITENHCSFLEKIKLKMLLTLYRIFWADSAAYILYCASRILRYG